MSEIPWHADPRSFRLRAVEALAGAALLVHAVLTRRCMDCDGKKTHREGCPHAPRHFTAPH